MTRPHDPVADSMGEGQYVEAVIVGRVVNLAEPGQQGICLQLCEREGEDEDAAVKPLHELPYALDFFTAGVMAAAFAMRCISAGPQALQQFHIGHAYAIGREVEATRAEQAQQEQT